MFYITIFVESSKMYVWEGPRDAVLGRGHSHSLPGHPPQAVVPLRPGEEHRFRPTGKVIIVTASFLGQTHEICYI